MARGTVITDDLIHHFYHIYADGQWREPVEEHFSTADKYHLLGALSSLQIGLVGSLANRASVIACLDQAGLIYDIVDEQDAGWEQITQNKLHDFAQNHEGRVLYAHTKGAANKSILNDSWRRSMCFYNVVNWRKSSSLLSQHDAVGCHWLSDWDNFFFGGNYWWANLSYIRQLPKPSDESRFHAEVWIGQAKEVSVCDTNPGWPEISMFTTEW